MNLITIGDARMHLRLDTLDDDWWLELWIPVVSAAVMSWLKEDWRAYVAALDSNGDVVLDSNSDPVPSVNENGELIVRPEAKAAALIELAQQYRFRDGDGAAAVPSHWGHGHVLGMGATSLLVALRKPTIS